MILILLVSIQWRIENKYMKYCLIFFREEGVPTNLIVDGAREQIGQKYEQSVQKLIVLIDLSWQ